MLGKKAQERETSRPDIGSGEVRSTQTSVISKDMTIIGRCETKGVLRIEGRVEGDVRAGSLDLTATGSIAGNAADFSAEGRSREFVIAGTVDGSVEASRVRVDSGGTVKSGVVADQAVIHGSVEGGIRARERLTLEGTAVVEGDVHARRLALKEGGEVNGTINMGDRADLGSSRTAEKKADEQSTAAEAGAPDESQEQPRSQERRTQLTA